MDGSIVKIFLKHFDKISEIPPRRHLRFGLPFNVEEVTKQARFTYDNENNTIIILRCFSTHKEYEKWYKSFKQ
jgi:hypothetical protein